MLSILAAVLLFGLIILIHEFGHFSLAKLCGIGVVEFSMGMGPRLVSAVKEGGRYRLRWFLRSLENVQSENTAYSIKLLPVGGSCMMVGEDQDNPDPRAFNNKPVFARIAVIAAGPIFNFLLAFAFAMVLVAMIGHDSPIVYRVTPGSPAYEAGLQPNDRIIQINGRKVTAYRDVQLYVFSHPNKPVSLRFEREENGKWSDHTVELIPKFDEQYQTYLLGVNFLGYEKTKNIGELLYYSAYEVKYCVRSTFDSIGMMLRRQVRLNEAVTGPVGIVSMVGETVEESSKQGISTMLLVFSNWILLLSSSLGIMNLLPLPALDGGRLVFLLAEFLRGKPIDPKKEGMIHMAGLMALMALMVLVLFNDIRRLL